ncbi:MAG: hypothetical protein ACRDBM_01920, partial [Sporomusa sp.]
LFAPAKADKLAEQVSRSYAERYSSIHQEMETQEKEKEVAPKMDNLYTRIEDGIVDDYDIERLKKLKKK